MSVVISAKDVGIEFYTSRRRKMQVRDLLFHGNAGDDDRHLLGAARHQLRHPRGRGRRPGRRQRQRQEHAAQDHRRRAAARRGRGQGRRGGRPAHRAHRWLPRRAHLPRQPVRAGVPARALQGPDRGALREHGRLRRPPGARGARPPLPAPVLRDAGAPRLRGHLLPRRADLPRRRGARRGRQGLPREVLHRAWRACCRRGAPCSSCRHSEKDLKRFGTRGLYLARVGWSWTARWTRSWVATTRTRARQAADEVVRSDPLDSRSSPELSGDLSMHGSDRGGAATLAPPLGEDATTEGGEWVDRFAGVRPRPA